MRFPTLYHQSKTGAIVSWDIWTEGSDIVTQWGQVDGEKQTTRKTVEGKNIGKSNETSPARQAELEAASIHKHKLDTKYSLTKKASKETVFLPMLAHSYRDLKKPLAFPVDVQPKLNGCRALAYKEDGEVKLLSRGGKFYDIQHIKDQLREILPEDRVLDGEIYIKGATLQEINRLIKKHRPGPTGSGRLEYWVYDYFNVDRAEKWLERAKQLDLFWQSTQFNLRIRGVETTTCDNEERLFELLHRYQEDGYEGAIIRLLDGVYELGHRSRSLLKLKDYFDAEYKVVDFYEGTGKFKGCVTWVCEMPNGQRFNVTPKGTIEQKKRWFKDGKKYIGRMLTVKYWDKNESGIPQFGVGEGFRIEEDLPNV
jgi:DNA ligase-1